MELWLPELYASVTREAKAVARSINGWIAYLKKSRVGANEPGANDVIREFQAPYLIEDLNETPNIEDLDTNENHL